MVEEIEIGQVEGGRDEDEAETARGVAAGCGGGGSLKHERDKVGMVRPSKR
jgi:hypothetical protein